MQKQAADVREGPGAASGDAVLGGKPVQAAQGKIDALSSLEVLGIAEEDVLAQFERVATGGVVNSLNSALVRNVKIPLPPLEVQKEIVAEIEAYQKTIDSHGEQIKGLEKRIQAAVARVWGEDGPAPKEV